LCGGGCGRGDSVGRFRDESRFTDEIQSLSRFLRELTELNEHMASVLAKTKIPPAAQDESSESPPDSHDKEREFGQR